MIAAFHRFVSALPPLARGVVVMALLVLVGALDVATGYELSFSVFYLMPIVLATWYLGRRMGYLLCVLSALSWYGADLGAGHPYSHASIPVWNTVVRLGFFLITASLLLRLRGALDQQARLAQHDGLTGLLNARTFMARGEHMVQLARRHQRPLAIGYIDLDGFKGVNDRHGHLRGDAVLSGVAQVLAERLRTSDLLARLGGDEFAVLCPETDARGAARVFEDLHQRLNAAARAQGWEIGFSIGVASFARAPERLGDVVRSADDLMYRVKHSGKNRVVLERFEPPAPDGVAVR